jgi:hypothetical protein
MKRHICLGISTSQQVVVEVLVMFYDIFVYDVVYLVENNEEQEFSKGYVHHNLDPPLNVMMR